MNNKRSNFTRIYFIGMAIIIIVMLYYAGSGLKSNNYKYNDLLNDLQNGKVTQLNISQNKEVPTGKVTVKLQDGSTKYVYITDVNQVISDIKDINDKTNQNIQPGIADVRRDSVYKYFAYASYGCGYSSCYYDDECQCGRRKFQDG